MRMTDLSLPKILRLIAEQSGEQAAEILDQAAKELERLALVEAAAVSLVEAINAGLDVGGEDERCKVILRGVCE